MSPDDPIPGGPEERREPVAPDAPAGEPSSAARGRDATRARSTVVFVHASDEAYGADRVLLHLVTGLRARGWDVVILLPDDVPEGWLTAQLRSLDVLVERLPLAAARRRYLRLLGLPGYAVALARARRLIRRRIRQHRARIVHVNTSALLVAAVLGRPAGVRLVWHVHEIVVRPRLFAWLFRLAPPLAADRVIAVSDAVSRHLRPRGWFERRVVTVRNGLPERVAAPLQALGPRDGRAPLVAFVGRLNRWKGYDVFLDAVARIASGAPAARFVVAGDPPPGEAWRTADVERRIRAAGLEDRVVRLGFVEDGAAVFDAADIAVAPSVWPDPLPTVVLEAMRAGCAVVASGHGGAPEMIEAGVSGVLVPPGDPAALAEAIEGLLHDPTRRAALGRAARERVTHRFGVARMVDEVDAVYRELLG